MKPKQPQQPPAGQFFPLIFPEVFSADEREAILQIAQASALKQGKVAANGTTTVNEDIRRSAITRVDVKKDQWLMKKLLTVAQNANARFQFDLTNGMLEPAQVAAYDGKDLGQYDWHLDIGPHMLTRKISISVPLNAPNEYAGGELQFNYGKSVVQEQVAGSAIVFPSYVLHKVNPVTQGCRYSLVTWVHGPAWR